MSRSLCLLCSQVCDIYGQRLCPCDRRERPQVTAVALTQPCVWAAAPPVLPPLFLGCNTTFLQGAVANDSRAGEAPEFPLPEPTSGDVKPINDTQTVPAPAAG